MFMDDPLDNVSDTWLKFLDQYFLRRYPMCNRRVDIVRIEPIPTECDADFARRVITACGVAGVHRSKMYVEDMIIAYIAAKARNPELRGELARLDGLELHEIQEFIDETDNKFLGQYTYLPKTQHQPGQGLYAPWQANQSSYRVCDNGVTIIAQLNYFS